MTEELARAKQALKEVAKEKYLSNARIKDAARRVKDIDPQDFLANLYEIAVEKNSTALNRFLDSCNVREIVPDLKEGMDFLVRVMEARNVNSIKTLIEKCFRGDDYVEYMTSVEDEAERLSRGLYELNVPRDVFVAYSSKDIEKVSEIVDFIEAQGFTTFVALRNLRHGKGAVENYEKALQTAMHNCKCIVYFSSENSRRFECDAMRVEIPYVKDNEPQMGRIEYLLEEYSDETASIAKLVLEDFFRGKEYCRTKEDLIKRIFNYAIGKKDEGVEEVAKNDSPAKEKILSAAGDKAEVKYCSNCGKENPKVTKFCFDCGNRTFFDSKEECDDYVNHQYCLSCGTKNPVQTKFCIACGKQEFVKTKDEYTAIKAQREEEERKRKQEEARQLREEEERRRREEEERRLREEAARKKREEEERKRKIEEERKKREEEARKKREEEERKKEALIRSFQIENGVLKKYKGSDKFVEIPNGIVAIADRAFWGCNTVETVEIPTSVTSIGDEAFANSYNIKKMVIPDSVTKIGHNAFRRCKGMTSVKLSEKVPVLSYDIFNECTALQSIEIPSSVKYIGDEAFLGCTALTNVTLTGATKGFGKQAFFGCKNLTKVVVIGAFGAYNMSAYGKNYLTIGEEAFAGCENLTGIEIADGVASIRKKAFYKCSRLTNLTLPKGLLSIGEKAFYECKGLALVTLPNSVTSIGDGAFCECGNLTTVTMSSAIANIGEDAFSHCYKLEHIALPYGVERIGARAFTWCQSLKSVAIPSSVTYVGAAVFSNCTRLSVVYVEKKPLFGAPKGYDTYWLGDSKAKVMKG